MLIDEAAARDNLTPFGQWLWERAPRHHWRGPSFGGAAAVWGFAGRRLSRRRDRRLDYLTVIIQPQDPTPPFYPFLIDYWSVSVFLFGWRVWRQVRWSKRWRVRPRLHVFTNERGHEFVRLTPHGA